MKETQKKSATPKVVATPVVATPTPTTVTIARSTAPRKGSSVVYDIPGLRVKVKVPRAAFVGNPPDALVIQGSPFAAPKATLTKEQRAALRAALTPADKARIARERATRAVARAAKLEAAAASS